jgi:hypothetical protein
VGNPLTENIDPKAALTLELQKQLSDGMLRLVHPATGGCSTFAKLI